MSRHRILTAATAVVAAVAAVTVPAHASAAAAATSGSGSYVPAGPCRVLDTREAGQRVQPGTPVTVDFAGRCGIPDAATSVVATLTITEPVAAGWARLSDPADTATSTVNYATGATVANQTVTPVHSALTVHRATHVVIDVTGAFVPAPAEGATSGRYQPVTPVRLLDTRTDGGQPVPARSTIRLPLPSAAPGAIALAVNITTTETAGPGFITAWPAGSARPLASASNSDAAGQTRAAHRWIPVSADGLDIYTHGATHLVVDLVGFFTGPSAAPSTLGLHTRLPAQRLVDTRSMGRLAAGRAMAVTVAHPATAAVTGNVTIVGPARNLHVTLHRAGAAVGSTSNVNAPAGIVAVANAFTTGISVGGMSTGVAATASADGAHLIIDVTGTFTGPATTPQPLWEYQAVSPGAGEWTVAPRTGTACEQYVLASLAKFFPAMLPYAAWLEVREVSSLDGASATMGTPWHDGVPRWVLTIRADRCTAGYSRREYVIVHELAHMWDFLTAAVAGYLAGVSETAPHLSTTANPYEWFADCATRVLQAEGSPHYTACADGRWQQETAAILATPIQVDWGCAPVVVPTPDRWVGWCQPRYLTPWGWAAPADQIWGGYLMFDQPARA